MVYSWSNWSDWKSFIPECRDNSTDFDNSTIPYPTRERHRSCVGFDLKAHPEELCGDDFSETIDIQKQAPTRFCPKSKFNNTDRSLNERKIRLQFSMGITAKWSDDLTDKNSAHFEYLSLRYARAIWNHLINVQRTGGPSDSTSLSSLPSSWKILVSSVRVKSFIKVSRTILNVIEAIFETIFDVLADADEENDSGLTSNAQEVLIEGLTNGIKGEIDGKHTISDTIEGGYTNFVGDVNFAKAEQVVIIQKCESNYVNVGDSCVKTCALSPCQVSDIGSWFGYRFRRFKRLKANHFSPVN